MAIIDDRIWWVEIDEWASLPRWRCKAVAYLDEKQSQGLHQIQAFFTKNGLPVAGLHVIHDWPDGHVDLYTGADGMAAVEIYANSCDPDAGRIGAYRIYAETYSDIVDKMCLPLNRHVVYKCYFEWDEGTEPPPPPPSGNAVTVEDMINFHTNALEFWQGRQ